MKPRPDIDDPLFELELRIARRADELSHESTMQGRNAHEVWCEAERQTGNPFSDEAISAVVAGRLMYADEEHE